MTGNATVIELDEVSKRFVKRLDLAEKLAKRLGANLREQTVHALDRVSLAINEGEVVGLVGESGCGKSTLGRIIAGLLEASAGRVLYRGVDRASLGRERARAATSRRRSRCERGTRTGRRSCTSRSSTR